LNSIECSKRACFAMAGLAVPDLWKCHHSPKR
jgi:hypothetical protein